MPCFEAKLVVTHKKKSNLVESKVTRRMLVHVQMLTHLQNEILAQKNYQSLQNAGRTKNTNELNYTINSVVKFTFN